VNVVWVLSLLGWLVPLAVIFYVIRLLRSISVDARRTADAVERMVER
jgi:hypothetical protein